MAIDTLLQDATVDYGKSPTTSQRKLGETETSYYLPSRESGVNDMYVTWTIYHPLYSKL